MSATFRLDGQDFMALNGGPHFTFSPAISFFVKRKTQEEVHDLWEKLSQGGVKQRCGWLKDKFGVSCQVVPTVLGEMLQDKDAEKARNVMKAMLQTDQLDIKRLQQAREQRSRSTRRNPDCTRGAGPPGFSETAGPSRRSTARTRSSSRTSANCRSAPR